MPDFVRLVLTSALLAIAPAASPAAPSAPLTLSGVSVSLSTTAAGATGVTYTVQFTTSAASALAAT